MEVAATRWLAIDVEIALRGSACWAALPRTRRVQRLLVSLRRTSRTAAPAVPGGAPRGHRAGRHALGPRQLGQHPSAQKGILLAVFQPATGAARGPPGGLPDLHVGVVSTDLGAGPYSGAIPSCTTKNGDDGQLLSKPRSSGCTPPTDPFITARDGKVNVPGTTPTLQRIFEAVRCIGSIGYDGCGFEMPLESMRRALDGRNRGFERDLRNDWLEPSSGWRERSTRAERCAVSLDASMHATSLPILAPSR